MQLAFAFPDPIGFWDSQDLKQFQERSGKAAEAARSDRGQLIVKQSHRPQLTRNIILHSLNKTLPSHKEFLLIMENRYNISLRFKKQL